MVRRPAERFSIGQPGLVLTPVDNFIGTDWPVLWKLGVAVEVQGAAAAQGLLRDLKAPLSRFEVRSPSLEDAYLKIVAATADEREESPLDDAPRRSFRR